MIDQVQETIDALLWNKRFVEIPDDIEAPSSRVVLVKDQKMVDRNLYAHERRYFETRAIREGVKSEQEIVADAISGGFWSADQDKKITDIQDHIAFLKGTQGQQTLKSRKKKLQKQIDEAQVQLEELSDFRASLMTQTAEYYAQEASILNAVRRDILTPDEKPLWETEQDFLDDRFNNPQLMAFLASQVVQQGVLPAKDYRVIARSMEWRILWISQRENLSGLFGRPVCDLTMRQVLLLYWSRVYDQVFEDPDRPDQDIIEDDEKLDVWLANKSAEREELKKAGNTPSGKHKGVADHHERIQILDGYHVEECVCGALKEKKGLGEAKQHDPSCRYGVWVEYTEDERRELAERFYGRNSKIVRSLINKEMEAVANKEGLIDEKHLRGKKSRMILGSETKVTPIKK